jgi:hypothetical protein
MFHRTVAQDVWDVCMLATAAFAVWRGGWAERVVALGMIVDSVAAAILQNNHNLFDTPWAELALDIAYLGVMLWVALRSNKTWPLFTAGFQLILVVIYFARLAQPHIWAWAEYTAIIIWSYMILIAIAVGTWRHWRSGPPARLSPSPSG